MPARTNPNTDRKVIKPFIGMKSDESSSINRKAGHFDLLDNCYANIDSIKKRKGFDEWFYVHTTGSRVYGLHNQESAGSDVTQVKIVNYPTDNLFFYNLSSSNWIKFTGHTFPVSDTNFVEMDGFDEWNGSFNVVETVKTGSTATDVLLGSGTGVWPSNLLVGAIARFTHSSGNVEYKIIESNYNDGTDDHIIFDEQPLNADPATGVAILIREKGNMFYIGGGSEFAVIGSKAIANGISGSTSSAGYKQLDGTSYSHNGFTGIESHSNRIFAWRDRRLSYSDLYNGHNYSVNAYFDFPTNVMYAKQFTDDIIIIYERVRVWALVGTDPVSWTLKLIDGDIGTLYPKTIANYVSTAFTMQLFVSSDRNVRAITSDTFKQISRETRLPSLTQDYIQDDFFNETNLCAGMDNKGKYTIFKLNGSFFTLNVQASEKMNFREWAWSKGSTSKLFNNAIQANGFLRLGDISSGQLYTWNVGNSDNGSNISQTIRRRGMNFDALGDKTKFKFIDIAQGSKDDSTTITVKAEANNSGTSGTINYTLGTHDPSTGNKHREYKIPNNPSNSEGSGHMLDYEITETSTGDIAPIEEIAFRYKPSLLK